LQEKFLQDGAGLLNYSGLEAFFGGLERIVGSPKPNVIEAMAADHCESVDSKEDFTANNYEVTTTSEVEWRFVAEQDHPDIANGAFPEERKISYPAKHRKPMSESTLDRLREETNKELLKINEKKLIREELIAARLCKLHSNIAIPAMQVSFCAVSR